MTYATILSVVFTCSATAYAVAAPPLKVMSFNVRFDAAAGESSTAENAWIASTGPSRRNLAARVITDANPDILCVQEALENQIQDIGNALPDHDCYGVGRDDGVEKGEYCGIFYRTPRFEKTSQGTFWLNSRSEKPGSVYPGCCCARIASWTILVDTQNNNKEYYILNTHWDHQIQAARMFSAGLIRKRLRALDRERPLIVVGDLNATPENPAYHLLVGTDHEDEIGLIDSYRATHPVVGQNEQTYHGFSGDVKGARIDYVLHTRHFHTQGGHILHAKEQASYPSDHFPVTATLLPLDK